MGTIDNFHSQNVPHRTDIERTIQKARAQHKESSSSTVDKRSIKEEFKPAIGSIPNLIILPSSILYPNSLVIQERDLINPFQKYEEPCTKKCCLCSQYSMEIFLRYLLRMI